jgi:hypothetical protein
LNTKKGLGVKDVFVKLKMTKEDFQLKLFVKKSLGVLAARSYRWETNTSGVNFVK